MNTYILVRRIDDIDKPFDITNPKSYINLTVPGCVPLYIERPFPENIHDCVHFAIHSRDQKLNQHNLYDSYRDVINDITISKSFK